MLTLSQECLADDTDRQDEGNVCPPGERTSWKNSYEREHVCSRIGRNGKGAFLFGRRFRVENARKIIIEASSPTPQPCCILLEDGECSEAPWSGESWQGSVSKHLQVVPELLVTFKSSENLIHRSIIQAPIKCHDILHHLFCYPRVGCRIDNGIHRSPAKWHCKGIWQIFCWCARL